MRDGEEADCCVVALEILPVGKKLTSYLAHAPPMCKKLCSF